MKARVTMQRTPGVGYSVLLKKKKGGLAVTVTAH